MAEFKETYLMELPNTQREDALVLWRNEMIRFKEYLEKHFETTITEDDIRKAIKVNNEARLALRKLYGVMKHDPAPVSYTHLDVYKRQRMDGCRIADITGGIEVFPEVLEILDSNL